MTQDLAIFMNSLRAVFHMGPLYHDGRGDARDKEDATWLPAFRETGHVPSRRGGSDGPGRQHSPTESRASHIRKSLVWNWHGEQRP